MEARDKICKYYIDLICTISEQKNSLLYGTAEQLAAKTATESVYVGGALVPSSYSTSPGEVEGRYNTLYASIGDYEPPRRPVLPAVAEPASDRAEDIELNTCGQYALLSDSVQRVSRFLFEYERILQLWAGSELAVDGYIPDSHDLRARNFLVRAGGDLLWSEEDPSNKKKYIDLSPVLTWSLEDVQNSCSVRGGALAEPSSPALRYAIRNICLELGCQFLMVKLRSGGGGLYFSGSGTAVPNDLAQKWKPIYYNSSDPSVQNAFNNQPWLLIAFHEDTEYSDFWLLEKPNELIFPLAINSRALCALRQDHPVSRASELLIRYTDDINHQLPSKNQGVTDQIAEINRVVSRFNEAQLAKMAEDDMGHCRPARIEIAEEDQLFNDISEGLTLSHSQLNAIVRRIAPLYERVSFTEPNQDAIYDSQLACGPDLDRLKEFLESYLKIAGRWTELVENVFYNLPSNISRITVNEEFSKFGEGFEILILAIVSAVAITSLCLNMGLLCCITMIRNLGRKGRQLTFGSCSCCKTKPINNYPEREHDQMEHVALQDMGGQPSAGGTAPPSFSSIQWQGRQHDRGRYTQVPGIISGLE